MVEKKNTVLIVGAGEETLELISSFYLSREIAISGVADGNPDAPGIRLAKALTIPAGHDYAPFLRARPLNVIINATGSDAIEKELLKRKPEGTEIISGRGVRLIAQLAESISFAAEARYLSVFQNMLSGVAYHKILSDEKGAPKDYIFMEINKSFEKLIGLKKEDILGRKVTEVFPWIKNSAFNWIDFYGKVAASEKEVSFEQYLNNVDRWYNVSAYSTQKGYFITIYSDITERRKTELALRKAYETLKNTQNQLIQTEKMETVGRLASGVAHEVKNPLAVLLQGIDYLNKKLQNPGKDILFALSAMGDAATRASMIIQGLTDFSRVSQMQADPENLNTLIEHCLLLVEADIKRYGIDVVKHLDKKISRIMIDKIKIQQVFINLFMNAIQVMPKGGKLEIGTIEKKHKGDNSKIEVTIEDTGPGIPEDVLGKVFDPFFTTKEVGKGTGLGLSIVSSIMEGHNGRIRIGNREDTSGARVTLEFNARIP